eukprot:2983777-Amphidinium_carterae.1
MPFVVTLVVRESDLLAIAFVPSSSLMQSKRHCDLGGCAVAKFFGVGKVCPKSVRTRSYCVQKCPQRHHCPSVVEVVVCTLMLRACASSRGGNVADLEVQWREMPYQATTPQVSVCVPMAVRERREIILGKRSEATTRA